MGILSRFWGKKLSLGELRAELLFTSEQGDSAKLKALCVQNKNAILNNAPAWWVTADPRSPDARTAWAVCRVFADSLDDRRLMDLLGSPARETIASRWEQALTRSQRLMETMNYGAAERSLLSLLQEIRDGAGPSALLNEATALGALGRARFGGGYPKEAIEPWNQALELARAAGDAEAVVAHSLNLYNAWRYLGEWTAAARQADNLADRYAIMGLSQRARYYRRQARRVLSKEPLVQVLFELEGLAYRATDNINPRDPDLRPIFHRNRPSIPLAVQLVQQGKGTASTGEMGVALTFFQRASVADPFDPDPAYQEGVCLMDMGRFDEAILAYDRAESLGPGWHHCRSNRWFAKGLSSGHISYEIYARLRLMADGDQSEKDRASEGAALTQSRPDIAPIWFHYGKALSALGASTAALTAFRRGLDVAEEPDIQTRLLFQIAGLTDQTSEGLDLLKQVQALRGNLVATAMAELALSLSQY